MSTDCEGCTYCGGIGIVGGDKSATWVYCSRCFARGPAVDATRHDAQAQAVAAWNGGRRFGRLGIAVVPAGMPAATCSVAERLRLAVDQLYAGELGTPDAAVLLLRDGARAHTITHRISDADALRVLDAVREAARIRAGATLKPSAR